MATAVQPAMIMAPSYNHHTNQCIDPEQEFFDFSQLPSPTPANLKRESSAVSTITSPTSTNIDDDLQTPAKPSHEYERFKQQTGLPTGSIAGLSAGYNSGFAFSSSGIDEMGLMGDASMMDGGFYNTGLPMESNVNMGGMDFSQSSYNMFNDNAQDDFVDPSSIEEAPRVRVWPGMHQQAALAQQAQQQRAQQMAQQRQQQASQQAARPQSNQNGKKTASPLNDARTEETIHRVIAQIRANSHSAAGSMNDGHHDLLPHIIRAKKDEEDMDEDERLLASEEGKRLSSKERRQLRNKVSARAFRSRRKAEYIGQLEGEIAVKTQEAQSLREENRVLREENARSRAFIERLLRHQAFTPFLEDLSRDESLQPKTPMAPMPSTSTPVSAPAPAPFQNQQFGGMSQPENTHVGMTLIPETQFDFSSLNINNNSNGNWGVNNGFGFQPRVFAVHELPEGPVNPLDTEAMSGKGYSAIFNAEDDASVDEVKPDYPIIERPVQTAQPTFAGPVEDEDEDDLYASSPVPSAAAIVSAAPGNHEILFTNPEKALAHYSLVISDEAQEVILAERLERRIAAMEPALQRLAAITSMLDL
ncbi:hypothetical protein EK21DRAFT_68854 [Setomelanomma holmii]|uniref:BZIP domain-containing protein n=1 Tax=Setomelanomma holmii TaxID=210430 RepID=A0A9P4H838_9PLEO|nr:hypothetical protein EK21DRAFT_68854 [Setomelanomma holmii]